MSGHAHIYRPSGQEPTVEVCLSRWGICDAKVRPRQAPAVAGSTTSLEAAEAIATALGTLEQRVYRTIHAYGNGGLTDQEGVTLTGLDPSTYRPRRVRLVELDLVVDSGVTRLTHSRRRAVVWIARE